MNRRFRAVSACIPTLLASHCLADLPRIWLWAPATGSAASDPTFVPLVFVGANPTSSPATVADAICDRIIQAGTAPGNVAILIQNWGRGTLVGNAADAVAGFPSAHSPWTAGGRLQMGAWMDAFIARYQFRQAADGVPAPSRWHLDCELRLPALCYPPNLDPCWGTLPLQLFAAMQADPRWDHEHLLMNPAGVPREATVKTLWQEAGSPAFVPSLPRDHPENRAWSAWWDSMSREAVDGALNASFYSKVEAAWPDSKCSEFAQSMRMDGELEPNGTRRGYADFEWWDRGWMASRWDGRATLQAPAIYVFGETFFPSDEDPWRANMRLHRANLDACLFSYGGVPASEVTPWVVGPGIALPFGLDGTSRAVSDDEFVELMALLRGRGIDEFMMWPGGASSDWGATQRAIRANWRSDLRSASVAGAGAGDAVALLRRADRRTIRASGGPDAWLLEADFSTDTPSAGMADGQLWIGMEASCTGTQPSVVGIFARDQSGAWRMLGECEVAESLPGACWIGPVPASGLVDRLGIVSLRVSVLRGTGEVDFDLVQVARAPEPQGSPPDIDGNGVVNGADLGVLLGDWSSSESRSDLDGNGMVGGADLGILLGAWSS